MIKVAQFMKAHGMDAESVDLSVCTKTFTESMKAGLAGGKSSLPMIPTYLASGRRPARNEKAVVIDAGGTNFRTAVISFDASGAVIEHQSTQPMPGSNGPVSWEEFIGTVADAVQPLMSETENIGFCFSYPVEITPERDGRVLGLTKQVDISGACGSYLGASLRAELERRGVRAGKIVVLNDTPAALLAAKALSRNAYSGFVGLVAGTGCNTCCELELGSIPKLGSDKSGKMLVTLESGAFDGFPRGDCDLAMDADLPDTGEYIAEKLISGRYLGQVCMYTLKQAAREGLFSENAAAIIEKMTEVATPTIDKWGSGRFPKGFNSEDRVNLVYIINELFERAARCIACKLCAILELTGTGVGRPVCIGVDGSLFSASRLLRPELEKFMDIYAGEIMGRRYEFVNFENMSLIGTAAAVLLD